MKRLLAKSVADHEAPPFWATLPGHCLSVLETVDALLEVRGDQALRSAGLGTANDRFNRIVRVAALLHDAGKCSSHFQLLVRGRFRSRQLLRHEAATLFLFWPGQSLAWVLESWLPEVGDRMAALVVAAAHHRKFPSRALASRDESSGEPFILHCDHEDFRCLLRSGEENFGALEWRELEDMPVRSTRRSSPEHLFDDWEQEFRRAVAQDGELAKLLPIAKVLLVGADVAGSALRAGEPASQWVNACFDRARGSLGSIVEKRLEGLNLRPFQHKVAQSGARTTLVRAGCGTGKTAAAYAWAARQNPDRPLWFAYPTTGTTTEGYRDYLVDVDLRTALIHGRASVDFELLNIPEDGDPNRTLDRVEALRAWHRDVVACTVDTVLGLVQNQRKGVYAFAALCGSTLVFDEIHAYDDRLFGSLLRFLTALPELPVLLMTASLPETRLEALHKVASLRDTAGLQTIDGPEELETLPRYVRSDEPPLAAVSRAIEQGERVLWVCNTVNGALRRARSAENAGLSPIVYHSRFRYADRVARHRDVIERFRADEAVLAITTQVAEMSLDLSADLLVTELAPVPALIQRLGRLNRHAKPDAEAKPKPFIVEPFDGLPYSSKDLDDSSIWLESLGTSQISQRDLVEHWKQDTAEVTPTRSEWIDGGFRTEPRELRKASPSLTVLMESDAKKVRSRQTKIAEVALPMNPPPAGVCWESWPKIQHLPVAPSHAIRYDTERGGQWQDV
ncbi:MAG: CRISPR-associated helicase Cas3' [Myxococcota bacterium]